MVLVTKKSCSNNSLNQVPKYTNFFKYLYLVFELGELFCNSNSMFFSSIKW
jgi:hypothetical protein